jgi:hypothetical protein
MTEEEVLNIFAIRGWKISSYDDGQGYVTIAFEDKIVSVDVTIKKWMDLEHFEATGEMIPLGATNEFAQSEHLSCRVSISTEAMCIAETFISDPQKVVADFCVVDFCRGFDSTERTKILSVDVHECERQMLDWVNHIDIEEAVERCLSIPTSSPGAAPIKLLAALAQSGDVATLDYYWSCFNNDIRLGFVPYVTIEYIERALYFAEQRSANSKWLPKSPRLNF